MPQIEPVKRYDLAGVSRGEWQRRSEWFRRLEGEQLRKDDAAAVNPSGVTAKGRGDTVLQGDGASVSYDLGLGYVGFLGFEVSGHDGQVLEIAWNERMAGDNAVRPRSQVGNNAIRYVLREGRQRLLTFMPQFVRFLRVAQRGEGQVTLHRLGLTEYRFDGKPKGNFPLLRRPTQSDLRRRVSHGDALHVGRLHGLSSPRTQRHVYVGGLLDREDALSEFRRHERQSSKHPLRRRQRA